MEFSYWAGSSKEKEFSWEQSRLNRQVASWNFFNHFLIFFVSSHQFINEKSSSSSHHKHAKLKILRRKFYHAMETSVKATDVDKF